jgi:hypothetical protein
MMENGGQEDTPSGIIRREIRVVLATNRLSLLLRTAKLVLLALVTRGLYGARWFRAWVFGIPPVAGLATHLLYRHKTRGWTRPWGDWKDLEAAKQKEAWR